MILYYSSGLALLYCTFFGGGNLKILKFLYSRVGDNVREAVDV